MIVVLQRDDLPPKRRKVPIEDIQLYHARLPIVPIQQADIIVLVDGDDFKILKNIHGISFTSLEALVIYMKSAPPAKVPPSSIKTRGLGTRKDHGNLRRRKGEKGELSAEESARRNGQEADP